MYPQDLSSSDRQVFKEFGSESRAIRVEDEDLTLNLNRFGRT